MEKEVVITGIGIVSPAGVGKNSFWQCIKNGQSCTGYINTFDTTNLKTKFAAQIKNFQAKDYMPQKDLSRVDKTVPITIAAVKEALGDTDIAAYRDHPAVILGTSSSGASFMENAYNKYFTENPKKISPYSICGSMAGMLSSEISQFFQLKGASHVITSGCTSSLDAIGYAFQAIKYGEENIVISGGADACVTESIMRAFEKMKVLSTYNEDPLKASRPFDLNRDGFVLGEGAYILILEEKEHAIKRGVTPYGEILSYVSNCDAYHRVKNPEDGLGNINAINKAISKANINKEDISYIALHGTATKLNDRVETHVMKQCFGNHAYNIPMSSIKSIFGHPQGACGAMALSATVLGMKNDFLPPTINLETSDSECDLDYIPNKGRSGKINTALINNLSFGSRNSVLIIDNML